MPYDALTGKQEKITARGFDAVVLQHEIDHLDGILFYDHIDPKDPMKVIDGPSRSNFLKENAFRLFLHAPAKECVIVSSLVCRHRDNPAHHFMLFMKEQFHAYQ
jgi:hypothetical protein